MSVARIARLCIFMEGRRGEAGKGSGGGGDGGRGNTYRANGICIAKTISTVRGIGSVGGSNRDTRETRIVNRESGTSKPFLPKITKKLFENAVTFNSCPISLDLEKGGERLKGRERERESLARDCFRKQFRAISKSGIFPRVAFTRAAARPTNVYQRNVERIARARTIGSPAFDVARFFSGNGIANHPPTHPPTGK